MSKTSKENTTTASLKQWRKAKITWLWTLNSRFKPQQERIQKDRARTRWDRFHMGRSSWIKLFTISSRRIWMSTRVLPRKIIIINREVALLIINLVHLWETTLPTAKLISRIISLNIWKHIPIRSRMLRKRTLSSGSNHSKWSRVW